MKIKNQLMLLILFSCILILSFDTVSANPVADPTLKDMFPLIILLFLIVFPPLETILINLFFSIKEKIKFRLILSLFVYLLNIMTVMITNMIFYFLIYDEGLLTGGFIVISVYFGIEVIPITIEYFSLKWFNKYYKKKKLVYKEYPSGYIFLMVLISNMISFLGGFLFLFFI